jgi:GNAT superfamily N-acetyltransferase
MAPVRIRHALPSDASAIVALIGGLADFERLRGPDTETKTRFARDLADPARVFEVLVAETADRLVGYALYFFTYSTFLARPTLYIEDLFVVPDGRRRAVGRALFLACTRVAARRGCGRLEWSVLAWNEDAQRFYRRLGGNPSPDWRLWGLSDATIGELAAAPLPESVRLDGVDDADVHDP